MTIKVVQVATVGENITLVRTKVRTIDKDCEEYIVYQIYLK